jgi:hypothetical protein
MLTKKERSRWIWSNSFFILAFPFAFVPSYWALIGSASWLVAVLLNPVARGEGYSGQVLPTKFYQKSWFWTLIFILWLALIAIYIFYFIKDGPGTMRFFPGMAPIYMMQNYFSLKYDWRTKKQRENADSTLTKSSENSHFPDK